MHVEIVATTYIMKLYYRSPHNRYPVLSGQDDIREHCHRQTLIRGRVARHQFQQGAPDFPFLGHINQPTNQQYRDIISPPGPGPGPGLCPAGRAWNTCIERRPEPPQLAPFNAKGQRLYSKLHMDD